MDISRNSNVRKNLAIQRATRLGRLGVYELEKQSISGTAVSADDYQNRIRELVKRMGI